LWPTSKGRDEKGERKGKGRAEEGGASEKYESLGPQGSYSAPEYTQSYNSILT